MQLSISEIIDRALTGTKKKEKKYNLNRFEIATNLAKEYNIEYKSTNALATNNEADKAFDAAIDLLCRMGVRVEGTNRIIELSKEEIFGSLNSLKSNIIIGKGKDRVVLYHRSNKSKKPPVIMTGHNRCSEEVAPKLYQAMAECMYSDIIEGYSAETIHGEKISGRPHEVQAAQEEAMILRGALVRAGRPGLHILYYPTSTRPECFLATLGEENGIRPTDALEVSPLLGLTVESSLLGIIHKIKEYGAFINSGCGSIIGTYSGGPESSAITSIAQNIVGHVIYKADYLSGSVMPMDMDLFGGDLKSLWGRDLLARALSRNVSAPFFIYAGDGCEPNNVQRWRGLAMNTVQVAMAGVHFDSMRTSRPMRDNLFSPLEIEFQAEVYNSVLKCNMTIEEANDIILKLRNKYDPIFKPDNANERYKLLKGKPFEKLYDLHSLTPVPEHLESYKYAKKELEKLGLEFEY